MGYKLPCYVVAFLLVFDFSAGAWTQSLSPPNQKPQIAGYKFAVQSQLVEVFATVTHGKQPVLNLQASDFEITEDGNPVSIAHLDSQEVPLYIALLVDISESVRDSLNTIQDAAAAFLDSLNSQDRMVLILFGSDIRVVEQTTDSRQPILQEIRNSKAFGRTKLYEALLVGMKHLEGKPGRKAMVCFTDGEDTASTVSRAAVLTAAAHYGYPIYAIGAGAALGLARLQMILRDFSEINGGKAFFLQSLRKLREAFIMVAAELRSAYVLSYYTRIPPDGLWHDLSVTTRNPAYTVHARKGFFAQKPTRSVGVNGHPSPDKTDK